MKFTLAFAGLVAGALAGECRAPTPKPASTPAPSSSGYFGVMASRSASPIHLSSIQARGGKFYIGAGAPSSYCPESVGASCPAGNTTVFAGGDKTLALGVVVPGGQQVYVAKNGELSYTGPHSAALPEGAVLDQFTKTAATNGNAFGYLSFETGFVACPVATGTGYQIYGQTQDFKAGAECLGFSALATDVEGAGAWQY